MTIRRKTTDAHIRDLKVEMENHKIFLQATVDELTELQAKSASGGMTKADVKRAEELNDLARGHVSWINSHKKEIQNYYKPATV